MIRSNNVLRHISALLFCMLVFISITKAQGSKSATAIALDQQGKYAEATEIWRGVTKANPRDAIAFASLGLDLARQEQYPDAVKAYRKALTLSPKLPGLQLNLGLAEFKQGRFDAAIPPLKAAAAEATSPALSTQAHMLLGMAYYGAAQFANASKTLKPLATADPTNIELRKVLAQSCLGAKDYDCALAEFRAILEQNPDSAAVHILLGEAYDGMKETDKAIAEFKAAEQISPNEPNLHFGLGYLYWKSQAYDDAKREFEAELATSPDDAQALAYLGDVELQRNNTEKAEALLLKSTQQSDKVRIAYLDLGSIRMQQKKYDEAVKDLQRAIAIDPSQPDAHYRLGRAYKAVGKNVLAEAEFAKTRELHQKADDAAAFKLPPPPTK